MKKVFIMAFVLVMFAFSSCGTNTGNNVGASNTQANVSLSDVDSHSPASELAVVSNPVQGYCGNTYTYVYYKDKKYGFDGNDSVTLTDILINTAYDPKKFCDCVAEYKVDTEFGDGYGLSLKSGFVTSPKGQADLTEEQIKTIKKIMNKLGKKYKPL